MKWYEFIILRQDKYRWFLFTPFFAVFAWGAIELFMGINPRIPGMIFLFSLIAWGIVWAIASTLYRKNLKK